MNIWEYIVFEREPDQGKGQSSRGVIILKETNTELHCITPEREAFTVKLKNLVSRRVATAAIACDDWDKQYAMNATQFPTITNLKRERGRLAVRMAEIDMLLGDQE